MYRKQQKLNIKIWLKLITTKIIYIIIKKKSKIESMFMSYIWLLK
jgi:hypothetical protein